MRAPWVSMAVMTWVSLSAQGILRVEAGQILDGPGSVPVRVERLVLHLHRVMAFVATDYRERTLDDILQRGAGNCADHARILKSLLEARGIEVRWVQEINLQSPSETRQATASTKVAERGNRMSVFGRRHNDHRWLEVWDPDARVWFPADSSIGVSGMDAWVIQRLGFSDRPDAVADMIAPVFVEALPQPRQQVARSKAYLIDGFDRAYGGRLKELGSWPRWAAAVRNLEPLASGAFRAEVNLHRHQEVLDALAQAYESLAAQARGAGLTPTHLRSREAF